LYPKPQPNVEVPNSSCRARTKEKYAEFDSKETINDLAEAIRANGHSVEVIDVREDIEDILINKKNNIDLVFNVAEGLEGYDREALVP